MFLFRRPSPERLNALLKEVKGQAVTYDAQGLTRDQQAPKGFVVDHNRQPLGHGQACFEAGKQAIRDWVMFDLGWVKQIVHPAPIEVGQDVCVQASVFPFKILNFARILYVVDERDGDIERFGFGYGTLEYHVEKGEERFLVEWNRADDSVTYDVYAFSQPQHILTRLGYPFARLMQKRFGRCTKWRFRQEVERAALPLSS